MLDNFRKYIVTKTSFKISHHDFWLFSMLGFSALAIRVFLFFTVFQNDFFSHPIGNSNEYHLWAQQILQENYLIKGLFGPGHFYPFVVALIYKIVGIQPHAIICVQLCLGVTSCLGLYLIGQKLFNRSVGMFASVLGIFYGPSLFFEGNLLPVSFLFFLNIMLLLSVYWAKQKQSLWVWCLPGVFLGFSVLIKSSMVFMCFIIIVWRFIDNQNDNWRKRFLQSIVLTSAMFIIILPTFVHHFNAENKYSFIADPSGVEFYLGNAPHTSGIHKQLQQLGIDTKEMILQFKHRAEQRTNQTMTYNESNRFWFWQAWREIQHDPKSWQRMMVHKLFLFFNHYEYTTSLNYSIVKQQIKIMRWPWISFIWLGPLGFIGLLWAIPRWRELLPWYGFFLIVLISNVSMVVSSESRYASMPVFFLFAGFSGARLIEHIRYKQWQAIFLPGVMVLLLIGITQIEIINQEDRKYHLATTYNQFGESYMSQKEYLKATHEFQQALDYLPDHSRLLLSYANALFKIGFYSQALQSIEVAYQKQEDNEEILTLYANILSALGKYRLAIEKRKAAIEFDPENPKLYFNLAETNYWAGQDSQGDEALEHVFQLEPSMRDQCNARRDEVKLKRARRLVRDFENQVLFDALSNTRTPMYHNISVPLPIQPPQYQPPPVQYYYNPQYQPPPPPVQYQHFQQQYQPPPPQPPVQYQH